MEGGDGNDSITVSAGTLSKGIDPGDGNDTVNLKGGLIKGYNGGNSIFMGSGEDILNAQSNGNQALDITDITGIRRRYRQRHGQLHRLQRLYGSDDVV